MVAPASHRSQLDQATLVRLLVSERVKMLAYIQSLVLDEDIAEDVFQDVCMLAVKKAATIKDETHLLRWLRTTARFLSMSALQKNKQRHLSFDDGLLDVLESAWRKRDADAITDLTESLRHCIDLLPAPSRKLIEQRYMDEKGCDQLAAETGRPVASLYVTFSRILGTLNDCICARLRRIERGLDG
jgi:RNA polymerase sigma-70 factor, ECF subfamily